MLHVIQGGVYNQLLLCLQTLVFSAVIYEEKGLFEHWIVCGFKWKWSNQKNGPHVWRLSEVILLLKAKQPVDVFKFYKKVLFLKRKTMSLICAVVQKKELKYTSENFKHH